MISLQTKKFRPQCVMPQLAEGRLHVTATCPQSGKCVQSRIWLKDQLLTDLDFINLHSQRPSSSVSTSSGSLLKAVSPYGEDKKKFHVPTNFLHRGSETLTCYEYYWCTVSVLPGDSNYSPVAVVEATWSSTQKSIFHVC